MLQENELAKLYKLRFSNSDSLKKNPIWQVLCKTFFQKWIRTTDTVIDLASGQGEFINNIISHKRVALDFNPDAKNYLDSNIEFHFGKAQEMVESIGTEIGDILFTSNFLEHLQNKEELDKVLEQIKAVLKPAGRFLIMGPNLRYLAGKYWDYYDHHLGLTHLSLCEALRLKDFEIETCIDKFLPYTTKSKLPQFPWLVWLYLKLPFVWRFMGKQFFIVAKKTK
jgi:SAM-dependent methyltransferase